MSFSGALLSGGAYYGTPYYGSSLTIPRDLWSPARLFADDEVGVWYDPSDLSTMFQDTAGTTPVTAAGQTVALLLDKSGRGNHATQAILAARPTLRQTAGGLWYLEFDGTDDFLVTGTITPGTDKVQVFVGVRKLSDAAQAVLLESSVNISSNNGAILLGAPGTPGNRYDFYSKGTTLQGFSLTGFASPTTNILTGIGDISGDLTRLRIDGTPSSDTDDQGTGNYLAYPLYIGRRAGTTLPFNGHLYSLITRFGPNLTDAQIAQAERWVAQRTGVSL